MMARTGRRTATASVAGNTTTTGGVELIELDLPYVDEHRTHIAAPKDVVWDALRRYVDSLLRERRGSWLGLLLGTEPRAGFEIVHAVTGRQLAMAGRHRFSQYRLEFDLSDIPNGETLLGARTYAAFPGVHGRAYRALVIGSRAHVIATRHILRSVQRRCAG